MQYLQYDYGDPLAQEIITTLQNSDSKQLTSQEIKIELKNPKYTKQQINRCLYKNLAEQKLVIKIANSSGKAAPLWKLNPAMFQENKEETIVFNRDDHQQRDDFGCNFTIVLIDLGNIHDCLKWCQKCIQTNSCCINRVLAFADYHFNGYGINPKLPDYDNRLQIFKVGDQHKNAADILMVWKCSELIFKEFQNTNTKIHFLVATKDTGFMSLAQLVTQNGHVMHFVGNKQELREHLE